MIEIIVPIIISSFLAFISVYSFTPLLIKFLDNRNLVVTDVNKKIKTMVVRPGGPVILGGIIISETILYLFFQSSEIIVVMLTSFLAFLIGYRDDKKTMGGWFKPIALIGAALPIILLGTYDSNLSLPIFGTVQIPVLYIGIILIAIPITGNTINSIDVLNGVASGFMAIASFSLLIVFLILQNYQMAAITIPLILVSLTFFKFHRFPSKIFPGDSGALTLGAMYGTIAIIGHVEIIAAIALLPAIINSFLFLSSMKRIIEHNQIKGKPVEHTEDFKLKATEDRTAPVTLVRLIIAKKPMSEKKIVNEIFKLTFFSGGLAILTAIISVITTNG